VKAQSCSARSNIFQFADSQSDLAWIGKFAGTVAVDPVDCALTARPIIAV
jgi:hypothetical protein